MKERVKLALEWERQWRAGEGTVNMSELCRVFGVSRPTGYEWIKRYEAAGHDLRAMEERSRRPHHSPTAVDEKMESLVIAARKLHPRWGPKKLRAWLVERKPRIASPSVSCIGGILKRHGLVRLRRKSRRSPVVPLSLPVGTCDRPNAVWCIDFKGKFRLANGQWCHVLTILDAHSRFLIRCEASLDPTGIEVRRVLDSAFTEFGLPHAMRSDNGPPFASTGAGGLTELSLWWLKLGIRLERIVPGKPQQNGRQERAHLTLEEVVGVPCASLRAQQRALDLWRREYNEERPHEALGLRPPIEFYERSRRRYPRKLVSPDYIEWVDTHLVARNGTIDWQGNNVFVGTVLWNERVVVRPTKEPRIWEVSFGPIVLGKLDERRLERGLILPRRKRNHAGLSRLSLDG